MNENTLIFRQQSSTSIFQKHHSKNLMNINDKENENSLTRLKLLELRSRFIQTLTQIKTLRKIQNRHLNIQFKDFSFDLFTFVVLIAQTIKEQKFYKLKTDAKTMIDNYHKMN